MRYPCLCHLQLSQFLLALKKKSLRLFCIFKINLLCQSMTLTLFTEWTGLLRKNLPLRFCFPTFHIPLYHEANTFTCCWVFCCGYSTYGHPVHPNHTHALPIHSLFHSFIKLCSIQKSQAFHMEHLNNCNYINVHYTWVMQYTVIIFSLLAHFICPRINKYLSFADGNSF